MLLLKSFPICWRLKTIKQFICGGHRVERGLAAGADEAHLVHLAELLKKGVIEAVEVQQIHRFVNLLELIGHHHFEHLVEGADAAGEGDEGIAVGDEVFLALGHGADADELGDALRVDDIVAEEVGDDADDAASFLQRRTADDAHEAEIASAIDEGVPLLRDAAAEDGGGSDDFLVARQRRAAEDCYVHCLSKQILLLTLRN